jgi:hypothetical protein
MQCMADEIAMLKSDLQAKDQQLQDEEIRATKVCVLRIHRVSPAVRQVGVVPVDQLSSELNILTRYFSTEFEGLSPSCLSLSVLSPHYIASASKTTLSAPVVRDVFPFLCSAVPPVDLRVLRWA